MITSRGAPGAHGAPETSVPAQMGSSAFSPRATSSSKTTGASVLAGPDTPPALRSSIRPHRVVRGCSIALLIGSRATGWRPGTGPPEPAGQHRGTAAGQAPHAGAAPQATRPRWAGPAVPRTEALRPAVPHPEGLSRGGTASPKMPEGRSPATGQPLRAASSRGPAAEPAAGRRLFPGPGRRRSPRGFTPRWAVPAALLPAARLRPAAPEKPCPGPADAEPAAPSPAPRGLGRAGGSGRAPPRSRGPSRSRPAPPRPAQAGKHRPPRSARPRRTKSRARPGPARPPYRRCGGGGRHGPRREPWKSAGTGDGRGWRAGGGGGVRRARQLGAARRGRGRGGSGGARGLAAAGPKCSRGPRDPFTPAGTGPPPAAEPRGPFCPPEASRAQHRPIRAGLGVGPAPLRPCGLRAGCQPQCCSRAVLYAEGPGHGFQAGVPPRRRDGAPAPRAAHEIRIITKHHFNHK